MVNLLDFLKNASQFRVHTGDITSGETFRSRDFSDPSAELVESLRIQLARWQTEPSDPLDESKFALIKNWKSLEKLNVKMHENLINKVVVKVFLSSPDPEAVRVCTESALNELHLQAVDQVIVALPPLQYSESKLPLAKQFELVWPAIEELHKRELIHEAGVADLNDKDLQALFDRLQGRLKPKVAQVKGCNFTKELTDYAKSKGISLICHVDPHPFLTDKQVNDLFVDCFQIPEKLASSWKAIYACRYTVMDQCRSVIVAKGCNIENCSYGLSFLKGRSNLKLLRSIPMGEQQSQLWRRREIDVPVLLRMPSSVRDLHIAVMRNDMNLLMRVDVNYPWWDHENPSAKNGLTALEEAIALNHLSIAKALIEAGANVLFVNVNGSSTLHKAAYHGRQAMIELLASSGAQVNHCDYNGNTPLHILCLNALIHNNVKCVSTMLQYGGKVNTRNLECATPLHYAAACGAAKIAELLIKWKADPDMMDRKSFTPFYYCVLPIINRGFQGTTADIREMLRRQLSCIKVLLNAGCDSLGFATWMLSYQKSIPEDGEFKCWLAKSSPESLKHLCRVFIQNRLRCNKTRQQNLCTNKTINQFDIPNTLKAYLRRRVID
ncbi:Ankyrin repeat, PH and SEC7 domain containing protein secG [Trichinella nelsoni]|uniref:Ankyrin repeat, PH and SEC7 domain containing protein secG n=1 Tax=Trichinella nelsoni TaxID=6336 RepID=A0A0V0RLA6_9BILA|nr:Ankyrin repeat, PH and SEC7 domain containing protein secG [Trichinella nelsoni]